MINFEFSSDSQLAHQMRKIKDRARHQNRRLAAKENMPQTTSPSAIQSTSPIQTPSSNDEYIEYIISSP